MAIKKPYSTEEIQKRPLAVVISILIAILLTVLGINAKLSNEITELRDKSEAEKNERIKMYEQMIFYKNKAKELEDQDSVMRERTSPYVNQILEQ